MPAEVDVGRRPTGQLAKSSKLKAAANDPAFVKELDKVGVTPMGESPAEFAAMIATEVAFWATAIKTLGPVAAQ
jgi:tripartite-type tricarboxylate transporter receptor subunit TctC